jgi:hypothetical protein
MKLFLVQALIFILGVILMVIDGSGGYVENMTYVSYLGASLCVIGIGFHLIWTIILKIKKLF